MNGSYENTSLSARIEGFFRENIEELFAKASAIAEVRNTETAKTIILVLALWFLPGLLPLARWHLQFLGPLCSLLAFGILLRFGFVWVKSIRKVNPTRVLLDYSLKEVAKLINPELRFTGIAPRFSEELKKSQLFASPIDAFFSSSCFAGTVNGRPLAFFFGQAQKITVTETGSGSNRRTTTTETDLFKGFIFVCDLGRKTKARFTLQPDFLERSMGWLGKALQSTNLTPSQGWQLLQLENVEFEKVFKASGNDQVEARLILTPQFQEEMLALRNSLNCSIRVAFQDDQLIILIEEDPSILNLNVNDAADWLSKLKFIAGTLDQLLFSVDRIGRVDLRSGRAS